MIVKYQFYYQIIILTLNFDTNIKCFCFLISDCMYSYPLSCLIIFISLLLSKFPRFQTLWIVLFYSLARRSNSNALILFSAFININFCDCYWKRKEQGVIYCHCGRGKTWAVDNVLQESVDLIFRKKACLVDSNRSDSNIFKVLRLLPMMWFVRFSVTMTEKN